MRRCLPLVLVRTRSQFVSFFHLVDYTGAGGPMFRQRNTPKYMSGLRDAHTESLRLNIAVFSLTTSSLLCKTGPMQNLPMEPPGPHSIPPSTMYFTLICELPPWLITCKINDHSKFRALTPTERELLVARYVSLM
jgi:hypothetical protein